MSRSVLKLRKNGQRLRTGTDSGTPVEEKRRNEVRLRLAAPEGYGFDTACRAGSWGEYPPYCYHPRNKTLCCVHDLGTTVCRTTTSFNGRALEVGWESARTLDQEEKNLLIIQLRRIFALDWNLKPFHRLFLADRERGWIAKEKHGWFLRSATFFEDVVKMLLIANSTFDQGKEMVERLVAEFGKPMANRPQLKAFPSPAVLLKVGVPVLRDRIKAGYRSQAIVEAAHRFIKGEFQEVELFRLPVMDLRRRLMSIHGMAASGLLHLMILLGRFDDASPEGYRVTTEGKLLKSFISRPVMGEDCGGTRDAWAGLVAWYERHAPAGARS